MLRCFDPWLVTSGVSHTHRTTATIMTSSFTQLTRSKHPHRESAGTLETLHPHENNYIIISLI